MVLAILLRNRSFMGVLTDRFNEGGAFFMSLILLCLLLALAFLIYGFFNLKVNSHTLNKMIVLSSEISVLGLVIGLLGSVIGLIEAFDTIQSLDNISQDKMGSGLKRSFLTTLFGSITFIIPRTGIIVLKGLKKE